jgi:hypothetical protein
MSWLIIGVWQLGQSFGGKISDSVPFLLEGIAERTYGITSPLL